MRFCFPILIILIAVSAAVAFIDDPPDTFPPALDPVSSAYLDTALHYSGLTRLDLEFEKKWASDTLFRLPLVENFLDRPLELPDTIDSWTALSIANRDDLPALVGWMFRSIDEKISVKKSRKIERRIAKIARADTTGENLPAPYTAALRFVLASFDIAFEHRQKMIGPVSENSLDSLLQLLPLFWTDGEDTLADSLEYYFMELLGHDFDTTDEIHLDSLYGTMAAFDLPELGLMTAAVAIGLENAVAKIESDSFSSIPGGMISIQTRWGKAIIGSPGEDVFPSAAIIIDPGGNDLYRGEHAAGVIGKSPFGVVIDISGDDIYDSRGSVFTGAVGVFGVGMSIDLCGNDVYLADHYAQGAGLFGSGILIDRAGDDIYQGGVYVQGAGNFGIGALIDFSGEDAYRSTVSAQAFAGPKGFGYLADHRGCDQYYCGGKYSHEPLAPFDYHSFGQGFAIGWRPDVSGGIGFLFDKGGNDTYTAGVYSQGVSYWYSLGLLVDNSGNDVYTSVWYPQGSGIHLSIGALVDRAGNDIYVSPQGPGQGAAHDYSVGFFSEYRGNDIYVIDGGNGCALTNSFALFVDRNGKDTYCKRNDGSKNWAYSRGARGTGNIGIFLDLEGDDHYSDPEYANDNYYWLSGEVAFGLDVCGEPFPDPVRELAEELAEEEIDTAGRTIGDIFNDASAWAVGSEKDKADEAFQELLDSGQVAADYICEKQLGTKSSLRTRTVEKFCKEKPELMLPCLFAALHEKDEPRRRGNAIYFLGEMKDTSAVDSLLPMLKGKKTRISVISALGKIADPRAVPRIIDYRRDKKQPVRYMVAKALAGFADPRGIPAMIDFLDDDYLIVRLAAQFGLAKMPEEAFGEVVSRIPDAEMPAQLHLLRALTGMCGKMRGDDDADSALVELSLAGARAVIFPLLENDDPVIRAHAAKALGKLGGERTLAEMQRRRELEAHPFVRAIYDKALKGK